MLFEMFEIILTRRLFKNFITFEVLQHVLTVLGMIIVRQMIHRTHMALLSKTNISEVYFFSAIWIEYIRMNTAVHSVYV